MVGLHVTEAHAWLAELWKALCFRTFPLMAEEHFATQMPECWRDAYFVRLDARLSQTRHNLGNIHSC